MNIAMNLQLLQKRELLNQLRYHQLRDNDLMYVGITNVCSYLTVHATCIILTNNYSNQQMRVQLLKSNVT